MVSSLSPLVPLYIRVKRPHIAGPREREESHLSMSRRIQDGDEGKADASEGGKEALEATGGGRNARESSQQG